MASKDKTLFIWQRVIPEKWMDAWQERVAWAGAENCVFTTFPGGKSARLQVYGLDEKRCRELVRNYGGKQVKTSLAAWIKPSSHPIVLPFPPYLCVVSEGTVPKPYKELPRLLIPAGMAFGTGDHATTGMCMRQLLKRCRKGKGRLLDLGTGSGILALAAAMQGWTALGMDFDPESIRTAKANQRLNQVEGKLVWVCADVTTWEPKTGPFDLISANLFSSLLEKALPKMKRWLKADGEMVLSGVLKSQLPELLKTLKGLKLEVVQVLKKGKWCCLVVKNK